MKKTLIITFRTFAIIVAYNAFVSCGRASVVAANQCEDASKKLEAAANAYIADVSNKTKCQAYVSAITELLKDCPNYYSGAAKDALVDFQKNACK
jgi:hypothetical protein